jgi:hypothetical protein
VIASLPVKPGVPRPFDCGGAMTLMMLAGALLSFSTLNSMPSCTTANACVEKRLLPDVGTRFNVR